MVSNKYYRAADIFSQPATSTLPARRGLLPIKRTQFYELLKQGQIPKPDGKIGGTRLWSDALLRSAVHSLSGDTDDSHSQSA